jgi:dienelactone hydrolase
MTPFHLLAGLLLFGAMISCNTPEDEPLLSITAESPYYYHPVSIKAENLPPRQRVGLSLEVEDAKEHDWHSMAYFLTNQEGSLDLSKHPSIGGSYEGLYPMGLFWSMKSETIHQIATNVGFTATFSLLVEGDTITQASIYRKSTRELDGIKKLAKRDSIVADFYLPEAEELVPGIIFLGGSGGNLRAERTSLYASEGFAVMDLQYFKGEGLPGGIIEIPLEYVKMAHDWFKEQPGVDPHKIGIVGRSRGSELAMLYAMHHEVSFLIPQVPSSVVWFGWEEGKSSWTFQGVPFAYAEYTDEASIRIEAEMKEKGIQYHDGPKFASAFDDEAMIERTSIAIEEADCPILFISGRDDKVWPSTMMADRLVERLTEKKYAHEFKHLAYADAGHNFAGGGQGCGIPYLPAEDYSNSTARGGTNQGNALAAIDSWNEILQFIDRSLN